MKVCILDQDKDLNHYLSEKEIKKTTDTECDILIINCDQYDLGLIKKYHYRYMIIILETLDHLEQLNNFKDAYLIKKPIDHDYFDHLFMSIKTKINNEVSIKIRNNMISLDCDDIIYITSNKRILEFYGKNGLISKCYMKLNDLQTMLPGEFVRIHQSFIVNKKYIQSFSKYEVILKGMSSTIPISRAFYGKNKNQLTV